MTQGETPMKVTNPCQKEWRRWSESDAVSCILGKGHKGGCVDKHGRPNPEESPYLGPNPIIPGWSLGHE